MRKLIFCLVVCCLSMNAHANLIGFADVVLDYNEVSTDGNTDTKGVLGAGGFRDLSFTRLGNGSVTGEVANAVLGDDDESYLSLREGQSITLGFVNENIVDGVGNDIFVSELGSASESANIFVSSDNINFTLLGTANNAGGVSQFDLADIGFTDAVTAVRVVSLNTRGISPGFDLEFIEALNRVAVTPANSPSVFSLAFLSLALLAYRKSK